MRCFKATEKSTGKTYWYTRRMTYGVSEFRIVTDSGSWHPKLSSAKQAAKSKGLMHYDGEPPIVANSHMPTGV